MESIIVLDLYKKIILDIISETNIVVNKAIIKLVNHWHVASWSSVWSINLPSCVGQMKFHNEFSEGDK